MSDSKNTQGTPGQDEEADTASGGAPEESDGEPTLDRSETIESTTDDNGMPVDNPSGG